MKKEDYGAIAEPCLFLKSDDANEMRAAPKPRKTAYMIISIYGILLLGLAVGRVIIFVLLWPSIFKAGPKTSKFTMLLKPKQSIPTHAY